MAYTDSFTRANQANINGNNGWTCWFAGVPLTSNAITGSGVGVQAGIAAYTDGTFATDHYSQVKITAGISAGGLGPAVRVGAGAGNGTFYAAIVNDGSTIRVKKWVDTTESQLGADITTTISVNDVVRIEASGTSTTTLTIKVNGSTIDTRTDSTSPITTGKAGFVSRYADTTMTLDDWEGGDLSAGGNTASPSKGAASLTGYVPLINPQLVHMGSDISAGGWTPSTGATLYGVIDEAVASDADYIQSGVSPSHDVCEIKFASATDPVRSDEHVIRYRISSTSGTGNMDVKLYCGATLIKTWTHTNVPATPTTYTQVLSGGEADSITNYADLRLRFDAY